MKVFSKKSNGGFGSGETEVRRERKDWRRKTIPLYRGAVNRRAVGSKDCGIDGVHEDKG
jgi:hypothetical protein